VLAVIPDARATPAPAGGDLEDVLLARMEAEGRVFFRDVEARPNRGIGIPGGSRWTGRKDANDPTRQELKASDGRGAEATVRKVLRHERMPFDPASEPTGNTCFILSEVYESHAGVTDHFAQAVESWEDCPALGAWLEKCSVSGSPSAPIFNSLW